MIDKESLRIGNYVEHFGDIVKVMLIAANENYSCRDSFMINIDGEFGCIYADPEETNPIPLTEAVLMAVGFQLFPEGYYFNFGCVVYKNFLRDGSGNWSGFNCNHSLLPLDSLHALQNVFYFLRGKELVINMEELKKAVG